MARPSPRRLVPRWDREHARALLSLTLLAVGLALVNGLTTASEAVFLPPGNSSWSNGMISFWQTDAGLPSDDLSVVAFDPGTESVYAGTWYAGMLRLNLSSFELSFWDVNSGLASNRVQALLVDPTDHRVFVGTDAGIQLLQPSTGTFTSICSAVGFGVYDYDLPPGSATLYAATDRGLLLCDLQTGGVVRWVNSTDGLPRDFVRSVYADPSRSRVYLAVTPGLSVYFEDNGTVINLNMTHGLPSPIVNSIDSTPLGDSVFLATSAMGGLSPGGISILNTSDFSVVNFGKQDGLSHATVDDVSYDLARNRLYLSVRPGGPTNFAFPVHSVLDLLDLESFNVTPVTTGDGLPGGIVGDLEFDAQKDLLLMAADESFGELTGPMGGGIVVLDPSAPTVSDLTSSVGERAQPIPIIANVTDDDGVGSVQVTYLDIIGNPSSAVLTPASEDTFVGAVPAQMAEGVVQYRLTSTDAVGRVTVRPSFSEWSEITVLDTTPPAVVRFGPQGNSVPVNATIALDFSEQMDLATVQGALSISPTAAIGPPVVEGTATRFGLSGLEYETGYTIVLASTARDLYGNPLDGDGDGLSGGDFQWSFGTVSSPRPPD